MQVVILCGGMGTRLREETESRPKPMVEIGGRPILWHIMKTFSHYGYNDFVLCLGYKGDQIKNYFLNYEKLSSDVRVHLGTGDVEIFNGHDEEDWRVTLVDTGLHTMTGARLKMVEKYIESDTFMLTYGDGIIDLDINRLLESRLDTLESTTNENSVILQLLEKSTAQLGSAVGSNVDHLDLLGNAFVAHQNAPHMIDGQKK